MVLKFSSTYFRQRKYQSQVPNINLYWLVLLFLLFCNLITISCDFPLCVNCFLFYLEVFYPSVPSNFCSVPSSVVGCFYKCFLYQLCLLIMGKCRMQCEKEQNLQCQKKKSKLKGMKNAGSSSETSTNVYRFSACFTWTQAHLDQCFLLFFKQKKRCILI